MQRPNPEIVTLNDILITKELSRRAPRSPNWQAEAEAMRSLAAQMARDSQSLMQTLADTALELCRAGTAGVSLLETTPNGEEIFRWNVLAGTLAHHVGGTTPRNFSPCGVCLEQGTPVLFSHPEYYFTYFQAANTPIVEGLVLPLIADSHVLGTIWIMSHDEGRQFDSEDVRVMTSLADFTATALLLQQRQTGELLAANAVLETEIVERKHVEKQTHALISSLPGGAVFVVDRDLRYLLAEGEALAIAGFKPEDFVGHTLFEVLPPELAASYEPMYRQALAGEPFEHEHNAHNHTYISRGTPLRAENGEIYVVLAVSYDITSRKRVEDERKQAEAVIAADLQDTQLLHSLATRLTTKGDIETLYQEILAAAIALTRANAGSIQILDEATQELVLIATQGSTPEMIERFHRVDASSNTSCGRALVTGDRTFVDFDVPQSEDPDGSMRMHVEAGYISAQSTPLIARSGKPIGMISTHWCKHHRPSDRELRFLDLLARQAADLIEQRQAEATLHESEAKYRSLFDSMDEGFCLIEMIFDENEKPIDYRFLEINPAFERQTGLVKAQGKRMRELAPDHEEHWFEIYGNVALTGKPIRFENVATQLHRWYDVYAFRAGEPKSRKVAILFKDISERKQSEAALRESEENFRTFVNASSDIVYKMSADWSVMQSLVGKQFIPSTVNPSRNWLATYIPEDEQPRVQAAIEAAIRNKHNFELEHQVVREDSTIGWTFSRAIPLLNEQGDILEWLGAASDVTERKQAEAALRESEAKYRSLFNSIDEGYALCELIYNENGEPIDWRLLEVNPSFERLTGFKNAAGKTASELNQTPGLNWLKIFHNVVKTGKPAHFEQYVESVDYWFDLNVSRLDDDSRQIIVVFNNITSRKRVEDERKRTEEALRESEAKLALELADARQLQFISSQLLQEENVNALYEQILEAAIALMRSDMGSMQMLHPDRNELQLLAWKGFDPASAAFWEWVRVDSESTCGMVLRTGERSIVPDVETCELMAGSGDLDSYRRSGVRAVQTTPLICRNGRVVGMISTHWQEPHQPSERELGLLDVLARQAADLIEQRQAEAALRESEERLRLALSAGEMGTWQYRFATDEQILDPTMRQLLGLPTGTDVIPLEDFLHIVHEDDRPQVRREIERCLHEGGEIDLEFRVIWQDGSVIWLKDRGKAIRDEDDRPLFLTGAAINITQRKQAEIALQESEEKYRSLFQSMDEGYAVVEVLADDNGEWNDFLFLEVNPAFEQQTGMINSAGRKATEILGTPNPAWAEIYGRVAETGESVRFEENETTLDRVFDLYAFRLGEAGSRRVAVLFTDITSRKRAEESLRESEEQQAFLLKFSDALRAEPDADAVANRAIRMLSEQMQLDRCYIGVYRLADDRGDFTHQVGNDRVPPLPDGVRLSDFPESLRVAFDRTLVINDVAEVEGLIDTDRQNLSGLGLRALVAATLRKRENNPLWSIVSVSAHPRRWTRGEIALVEEVTERTWAAMERARAEAALRESEAKYRSLFESIDEGFCIFKMLYNEAGEAIDFRYIETNPGFERQSGRRPQPGQTMRELFPEAEDMWLKDYAEVARTGQPKRFIDYHEDLDRWFDVFVFPTSNGKNQLAALFSDVTDEKWAEAALRESEERLQKAISIETVGVLFFTLDGRITDANDTFLQMSGYSRDELRNIADCQDLTPPEFWDVTSCAAEELATLGKTAPYEKQHIRKDGSRWWGLFSPTRLKGSGRNSECVEFVIDISDRKQAEEQVHRAAEMDAFRIKLSDALRSLSDPAEIKYQAACVLGQHLGSDRAYYVEIDEARSEFVVAGDWHQPGAPSHAHRYPLSGWPMPWLVDGQPWVVRNVDTDPAMPDDQPESYRGNDIGALIVVPLIKDGHLVATLATNQHTPRDWTADEIISVQETAERTWAAVERAYAEAALRDSEQRLSVIFAQAAVGLAEISLNGHFEQVNDALCRMLGRSRQELLAATVPDVTYPEDAPKSLDALAQLLETGESISLDKRYLRPDDTFFWANSILTRLDDKQGQPYRVLAVTVDLSDRKQAEAERLQRLQEQAAREEERQRAESLAELDRAKTLFFSNVSTLR